MAYTATQRIHEVCKTWGRSWGKRGEGKDERSESEGKKWTEYEAKGLVKIKTREKKHEEKEWKRMTNGCRTRERRRLGWLKKGKRTKMTGMTEEWNEEGSWEMVNELGFWRAKEWLMTAEDEWERLMETGQKGQWLNRRGREVKGHEEREQKSPMSFTSKKLLPTIQ